MTAYQLIELLKKVGIWRADVVEFEDLRLTGVIEVYVPPTSRVKALDLVYNYLPVGLTVKVIVMPNPLKYKKYTYRIKIV